MSNLAKTNLNNLKLTGIRFQYFAILLVVKAPYFINDDGYFAVVNKGWVVYSFDEHIPMNKAK